MLFRSRNEALPRGQSWAFGIEPLWWLAVAVSAYAFWHFCLLWKALGARGTIMRLSPEGLIMPSLGFSRPIPWSDVEASNPVGLSGMMGFIFDLRIDPAIHKTTAALAALHGDPSRRAHLIVRVPSVLSVCEKDILRTVGDYKTQAAEPSATAQTYESRSVTSRLGLNGA